MVIGLTLLIFTLAFLFTTVGILADWKKFDSSFLDDRLSQINSTTALRVKQKLEDLAEQFQKQIRPVWKSQFISLYCFLPWYALANILLLIGAKRESPKLIIPWLVATVGFLIWTFALVAAMFAWDTTSGFVGG